MYLRADIHKPIHFISAGLFTADREWIHSERVIDSFEIIQVIRGKVFLQQDEDRFELQKGDALLLLPGHSHKGYAPSVKGTSFFWLHFSCSGDFSYSGSKEAEEELILRKNNPYFSGLEDKILIPSCFHPDNPERLSILFQQILHVSESRYYSKKAGDYLATSLAIELTDQAVSHPQEAAVSQGRQKTHTENLSKILEWIRLHHAEKITLKDAAYEFSYSREYLARTFKRHMGMSIQEYINKMKVGKARELLIGSDANIKHIAAGLGFTDDKYFHRIFKQYEKITPGEYRRAYFRVHTNNR